MEKRRAFFSFLFFIGTLLAVLGWGGEYLHRIHSGTVYAIAGHVLQIVGVFSNMVTPDDVYEESQDETASLHHSLHSVDPTAPSGFSN